MEFDFKLVTEQISKELAKTLEPELEKLGLEFQEKHQNVTPENYNQFLDEYFKYISDNSTKFAIRISVGVLAVYHETLMEHLKQHGI